MTTEAERRVSYDSERQEYYRETANRPGFREALAKALVQNGEQRVFDFTFEGNTYFVKQQNKKHKRRRFRWHKRDDGFEMELMRCKRAYEICDAAPELVLATAEYFVTLGNGTPLQVLIKPDVSDEITNRAFYGAGRVLSRLHEHGLAHGRPVLRDIAYDWEPDKTVLLDWENTYEFSFVSSISLDILLFLHGYFREEIDRPGAIAAAIEGYMAEDNGKIRFMAARSFLLQRRRLVELFKKFDRFGWIDLQAITMAYDYLLAMEIPS